MGEKLGLNGMYHYNPPWLIGYRRILLNLHPSDHKKVSKLALDFGYSWMLLEDEGSETSFSSHHSGDYQHFK
jgi:hypothetical protein